MQKEDICKLNQRRKNSEKKIATAEAEINVIEFYLSCDYPQQQESLLALKGEGFCLNIIFKMLILIQRAN